MSDSNRLRNYTVGFVAGVLLAGAVGYSLWDDAVSLEEDIGLQAEEQAAQYTDPAKVSVECEATDAAPSGEQNCITSEQEAANEAERSAYDLEAQQIMANWTRVMGKAAIIGMAVGVLGLFLIFVTFWETRKAARTSENTYNAYIATERARLAVTIKSYTSHKGRQQGRIVVANIGKTACLVTQIATRWQTTDKFDETSGYLASDAHELVEPSKSEGVGLTEIQSKGTNFLRGIVRYKSPLGSHISHFCFRLVEVGHGGLIWADSKGDDWPKDT